MTKPMEIEAAPARLPAEGAARPALPAGRAARSDLDRAPATAAPPAQLPPAAGAGAQPLPSRQLRGRHRLVLPVVALAIVLALAGFLYRDHVTRFQTTDDAFIAARSFAVAPKVAGYIVEVPVTDNQHVRAGDTIARIDDRDYQIALEQAEAQVAAAQANVQGMDAQIAVQRAQVVQAKAQVDQAAAALTFAKAQAARYEDLARRGVGSVQAAQQFSSQLQQQEAALKTAQAAQEAAERRMVTLTADRAGAQASLTQANAQRDRAHLDLANTVVTAAQPGRMVGLSAAVGQYVGVGTALSMFVPDDLWVVANFKETQLTAMRPGQPATVAIDAYPGHPLQGHVASIQPGSGTAFSLLPAENATGNYVKVTQRVPVKIALDNPPADVALGPGMSVEPSVRVDPAPSLFERLAGRRP